MTTASRPPAVRFLVTHRWRLLTALAAGIAAALLCSACSSSVEGVEAGNTRVNTSTTQPSQPLNSSVVLTPQSSAGQPSGRSDPGATADLPPSPDGDQTTALRSQLRSIDPAFDTDDAASRAVAVCTVVLSGVDQLQVAAAVRQQFGADLSTGTVTAVENVITGSFCGT